MSTENLPDAVSELLDDLRDALGGDQEIPTGPMRDGPRQRRTVPIRETQAWVETIPELGKVAVFEVGLDLTRKQYAFHNNPDNPEQFSPAEYVHAVFEEVGITVPRDTRHLGVQLGHPDRHPDTPVVQGYVPLDGEDVVADGGIAVPLVIEVGHTLPEFLALLSTAGAAGMARILTDLGEEYTVTTDLSTATIDVGVYDDASGANGTGDAISDTDDLAALTSEPSDGNYVRQSEAFTASDISGDWGIDTDTDTVFDMTDTTGTVDSWFMEINATLGGGAGDHLICTGAMSQAYDLSDLTQLTISSGGVGYTVD